MSSLFQEIFHRLPCLEHGEMLSLCNDRRLHPEEREILYGKMNSILEARAIRERSRRRQAALELQRQAVVEAGLLHGTEVSAEDVARENLFIANRERAKYNYYRFVRDKISEREFQDVMVECVLPVHRADLDNVEHLGVLGFWGLDGSYAELGTALYPEEEA